MSAYAPSSRGFDPDPAGAVDACLLSVEGARTGEVYRVL